VPTRISYDNSTVAVAAITGARCRTPTREFLRPASHFLFDYRFCRVGRPNEKGHVEAMVKFARRNYLVPVPEAAVVALAADANILAKSGRVLTVGQLATEYGFTDADGRQRRPFQFEP
jgi:transposase